MIVEAHAFHLAPHLAVAESGFLRCLDSNLGISTGIGFHAPLRVCFEAISSDRITYLDVLERHAMPQELNVDTGIFSQFICPVVIVRDGYPLQVRLVSEVLRMRQHRSHQHAANDTTKCQ